MSKMTTTKHYNDTVDAVSRAIAVWFETHPGADPRFKFPPEHVVVTGDLCNGAEIWEANADGRKLVTYVDEVTALLQRPSMLQFQVCYQFYQRNQKRART
jgi:hypothetical protein